MFRFMRMYRKARRLGFPILDALLAAKANVF
jgi:hypothetical protein